MKTPRIAQNFRGRRAVIFTTEGRSLGILETTLRRLGLEPDTRPVSPRQVFELPEDLSPEADLVIIDGDLNLPQAWPESYNLSPQHAPCPTVGLVGTEAPSRLKAMLQLGAASFLQKPIHSGAVYSALYLGVNAFEQIDGLKASLDDMGERRRKRIYVIKAVAALMRQRGLNEDAAYDLLRKESMRARVSVEDHCESLMLANPDSDLDRGETKKRCQAR
ncbi:MULTISPECIES: ANTAR domain-containing response regulator [unclassified Thioclava]|uniref:ANTAR domain-containing response regulator n=1 Tax=unclassified Thioclava TaxID=2621713 RepID=UPI0009977331|nr:MULTISPECIES: ANTAR domain-containing protein [unclassified Thioclava]MPQ94647.1 ANTAR domain-containing protein [Thioclava sp. JE_KL1]OOY19575.1 hypothetical protein BMI86_13115 [Thioclava sp. DLFJ5-1]